MTFYDKFMTLCNEKHKYPATVCKEMGLSPSATTRWREGSIPNRSTIYRIADYFEYDPAEFYDYVFADGEKPKSKQKYQLGIGTDSSDFMNVLDFLSNPMFLAYTDIISKSTIEQRAYLKKVIEELIRAKNNSSET